jgi:hypothetical protein
MTMHSEIYRIAYQLSLRGKTPSVALIRAKLSKPTSLPDIIVALRQWKLTPELGKELGKEIGKEHGKESKTLPAKADDNEQDRLTAMEQRLTELESKVTAILILLEQKTK